jgi:hypothetical protein
VTDVYQDRWISCTEDAVVVRWYYLWGAKRIPYAAIRSVSRAEMRGLRGRGRIWGTANPRYWASLDPGRPRKSTALILDLGRAVSPYITPDDASAVADIIVARAGLPGVRNLDTSPFV